jgi:hypothetical protein
VTSEKAAALAERAGQLVSNVTNIRLSSSRRKPPETVLNNPTACEFQNQECATSWLRNRRK